MTPRVLVAGYSPSGNTGDEAILTVLLQDLRARRPGLEFVVVSADPAGTAARHHVRSVSATDIPALLDAARESDLVLLGGGGVFRDYWGCPPDSILTRSHAGMPFYAVVPLLAALTGRPCMIYAAAVGPLDSEEGRRLTRHAFEQATVATVCDDESRDVLREIGVTGADVRVTADPVFNLRVDADQAAVILSRSGADPGVPRIAVCVQRVPLDAPRGAWEAEVARALDTFVADTGAFVVFVPFGGQAGDFPTGYAGPADRVIAEMARGARASVVRECRSPGTLAGVLGRCDLVIGMDPHAVVFAASAGVPVVPLVGDPRLAGLVRRLGLEEYAVPLAAPAQLGERLSRAWARREAVRAALTVRTVELRELAAENARLAAGLLGGPTARTVRAPAVEWLASFALEQARRLAEQRALAGQLSSQLSADAQALETVSARANALAAQLATATGSVVWRVAERVRERRRRLAPEGTRRDLVLRIAMRTIVNIAQNGLARTLAAGPRRVAAAIRRWLLMPRGLWALDYRQESDATVTLYTDRDDVLADYRPRRPLSAAPDRRLSVSLIATARNERRSVARWLASVAAQTRLPDEIVIVDAGSTDGTADALAAEAARLGLTVRVVVEAGANIARGRNLAIQHARGVVLAATDLGCRLTPTWLERIVAPLEDAEGIEVAAGWYVALERGRPIRRRRWPTLEEVDPGQFLPSSRSVAFTRGAWAAAGGYPEWLTLTGEDTWFALELRRFCERWAFVPDAVVEWDAPATITDYWRKIYTWSVGDGESGVGAPLYWRSFRRLAGVPASVTVGVISVAVAARLGTGAALLVLAAWGAAGTALVVRRRMALGSLAAIAWEVGGEAARALGFLRGAARRQAVVSRRHRAARGMVFILSGVPIDDTGGGARCTQLALELVKQNWYVVFVSRFPRYETTDLGLRIRHPRLFTVSLGDFEWRRFVRDHAGVFRERAVVAIVEFPLAEFLPLAQAIRQAGGAVVYDLLDNWDSTLGGEWYSPAVERQMIALSDVLVATATPLAARLATLSDRDVTLLPNAVNVDLFDPGRPWPRPADYPSAPWSMIYFGALWGDWFDWELLCRLALAYPEAAVVMIGDYRARSGIPGNVHFLGLKAQVELPAYLTHADVAIVPWKTNPVTHATSPLKVYEYLAMRRPVVAPRLDALAGIPGVFLSSDTDTFVRNVGRARGATLDQAIVDAFVRQNSWPERIRTLVESIARANPRMASEPSRYDEGRSSREAGAGIASPEVRLEGR